MFVIGKEGAVASCALLYILEREKKKRGGRRREVGGDERRERRKRREEREEGRLSLGLFIGHACPLVNPRRNRGGEEERGDGRQRDRWEGKD